MPVDKKSGNDVAWKVIGLFAAIAVAVIAVAVGLTWSSVSASHSRAQCSRYHAPSDCKVLFP